MNEATRRARIRKLLKYEPPRSMPGKLTVVLEESYQEVIDRIGILQGESKSAVIRSALDCYAGQFGTAVLFPSDQPLSDLEADSHVVDEYIVDAPPPRLRVSGLYGGVDEQKSLDLISSMLVFHHEGAYSSHEPSEEGGGEQTMTHEPFKVIINTPGGNASDMFAIYDLMRVLRQDCNIETLGIGEVMSAGVLILAAGSKGHREIGANCRVMLHSVQAGHHGSIENLQNEMRELQWVQEKYVEAMVSETKMTRRQVKKLISNSVDSYLGAEEAVKYGIADRIV